MPTRTNITGCLPSNPPATMQVMSLTPIMDNIDVALNHAIRSEMDVDPGWMCVPEIHVSQLTWGILQKEFTLNGVITTGRPEAPADDEILGYMRGYPIKRLKYGQGWTIIYRETEIMDKKRMI